MAKQKKINVLICFDDVSGNYTRHAAVTIFSLLETNKNNKIKIYIISSILSKENIAELKRIVKLYDQEIKIIIRDDIIPEDLKKVIIDGAGRTWGAWYRLFFPRYIKNIDRILYMDCDVLVMKDISEIYNMNMGGKAIVGYYDAIPGRAKGKIFHTNNYINSGVLLFDVKKYELDKINPKNMEEINIKYGRYFNGSDQDKINLLFKDDIQVGKKGMNYLIWNKRFNHGLINKQLTKVEIVHCLEKPYKQYAIVPKKIKNLYYHYLNLTKWKGFSEEKANYGFVKFMQIYVDRFLYNLGNERLGDRIFGELVYFKWKIQNFKTITSNKNYNKDYCATSSSGIGNNEFV